MRDWEQGRGCEGEYLIQGHGDRQGCRAKEDNGGMRKGWNKWGKKSEAWEG